MSVEAITWALKAQLPSSPAKFVLVVLANCASGDTFLAYPSAAYLAEATGQNRKTVLANLARLRDWQLIEDTGRRVGATRGIAVYRLAIQREIAVVGSGPEIGTASENGSGTENGTAKAVPISTGSGPNFDRKRSQIRDTETKATNSNEKNGAVARLVLPDWLLPELWADWHKFRNARAGWTPKARELSLAKLCTLQAEGQDPRLVIEQSIERGWTGLFPIRAPEPPRGPAGAVGGGHNPGGVSPRLSREEEKQREGEALRAMREQLGALGMEAQV